MLCMGTLVPSRCLVVYRVTSCCSCLQGCFDQRIRAWQRWQEAQSSLQKKREAEAKLLWANKPDKLQQAKEEINEVTCRRCNTELGLEPDNDSSSIWRNYTIVSWSWLDVKLKLVLFLVLEICWKMSNVFNVVKIVVVSGPQWESRVTQYERDFDRVGMTVRKEFLRFEVRERCWLFKVRLIRVSGCL